VYRSSKHGTESMVIQNVLYDIRVRNENVASALLSEQRLWQENGSYGPSRSKQIISKYPKNIHKNAFECSRSSVTTSSSTTPFAYQTMGYLEDIALHQNVSSVKLYTFSLW
jgi:hypothetical protein